ncbi:protein WVD2-like 4 isoform X2 [Lotus japonicus]|uniref:protein WVD2-like 4 isoform X2 n=1 Tax=Lotus japonicus TaxID=34305 RepID=UPI00258A8D07|nr:protein WVD2-like 4 isoform X2 [Lotus japonicus]
MGDSACLMQPFCYASGITNEANENNSIHALGQSISFGRFMSESLAWEKWSSFSHNRYVEEAERYSRPGSVAQKKAFFEAHYKKLAAQKAAAMLEQANNAEAQNNATEQEDASVIDDEGVVKGEQDAKVLSLISESDPPIVRAIGHDSDSNAEASIISESNMVEEAEPDMEQAVVAGNSIKVELKNQLDEVDAHKEQSEKLSVTPLIMTPTVKVLDPKSDQEVLAWTGKKKPPVSLSELLKANATSRFTSTPVKSTAPNGTTKFISTPVKPIAPISSKRDNIATPMSNKLPTLSSNNNKSRIPLTEVDYMDHTTPLSRIPAALNTTDKKRSTPKSLQMSANFTPIRELNRLTASVMRKFESTRAGAGSSKASNDSLMTPLRTPTMVSKEMQKHSSLTPLTEKKRNKTPIDPSTAGNRTSGPKWRLLYGENKMRSPVITSPFNLKTEERAARRKKKLEEKFNANEPQKVQLHTKLKEKAGTEIRKLSQSFCFKARPLPDFYKERPASINETRKNPWPHSESPKEGRKPIPCMAEGKNFFTSKQTFTEKQ